MKSKIGLSHPCLTDTKVDNLNSLVPLENVHKSFYLIVFKEPVEEQGCNGKTIPARERKIMNSHMFHGTNFTQLIKEHGNVLPCGFITFTIEFIKSYFSTIGSLRIIKI